MGKYALLIGVDTYGEGLQPLPAASKDVAALREVLLNPQMGGFDEAKPLINPAQPEMAREIEVWFQDRQPEDLVLLFFSGHGVKDDRRDLYFAAANTEKQRDRLVRSTATSARFLHDCIRGCKAKYQVLILDCCFSGAFGDLVGKDDGEIPLQEQLGAEGRVVLTSTSAVDYSFEEKGVNLSIYTRYLVEGIATGAADEDNDGVITAEELHRYAGRKVEEASPAMSPKIFIPQGTGYRIRLARSPQDDPRLKYRKEAERRATAAEFTIPAKRLLMGLRAELGISEAEAEAIESEVLKPHREYQRKRQEYQETLHQCLEGESPLSQRTINDLRDYQAYLRLKPEDVAGIERAALNGNNLQEYIDSTEWRQEQEETLRKKHKQQSSQKRDLKHLNDGANTPKIKTQPGLSGHSKSKKGCRVIGIDFGSAKSVMATFLNEKPAIIPNSQGLSSTPSVVACKNNGDFVVGETARRQASTNPRNVFYEIISLIGNSFEEVEHLLSEFPYEIIDVNGAIKVKCPFDGEQYSPEQIAAKIFQQLKDNASLYLGESVTQAVIAVPAHFNYLQRQAIRDAGKIAGLEVLRMHIASTAAAISYGLNREGNETILIFDFGSRNLNISILEIGDGVFEVLATSGDGRLGGKDFDRSIANYLAEEFHRIEGIDLRQDKIAWRRLMEASEKAKIDLSTSTQTEINLPFISANKNEPKHMDITLTRAKFEGLCYDIIKRCRALIEDTINDIGGSFFKFSKNDIDEVVMVGGSSRIPVILNLVEEAFGKVPNQTVNPDEVVALGTSALGGVLSGMVKDLLLLDVTPRSLGVETSGGIMTKIVLKNTTVPTKKSEVFSTSQDGQTSVEIHVLQGDHEMAVDNKRLVTLNFSGISPALRGVSQIEVMFDIDANEILYIFAKDKTTGKEQSFTLCDTFTVDVPEEIADKSENDLSGSLALRNYV
jgi:molecular chaperone DnaK